MRAAQAIFWVPRKQKILSLRGTERERMGGQNWRRAGGQGGLAEFGNYGANSRGRHVPRFEYVGPNIFSPTIWRLPCCRNRKLLERINIAHATTATERRSNNAKCTPSRIYTKRNKLRKMTFPSFIALSPHACLEKRTHPPTSPQNRIQMPSTGRSMRNKLTKESPHK